MIRGIITSPLASLLVLVLGTQFFQIYVTLALTTAGYSETSIGIVHTASYLGLLVSALHSEKLIHRIGHIRTFTTFSGIVTATILIQSFNINLTTWIIARFFSGLSLAGLYVTIESWLLAESTIENRGKCLAIYMVTLYCGQAISPQLLHIVNLETLQPYVIAALFCTLSNIPVSVTYKISPILPNRTPLKIREVFSLCPYAFSGCFASGLILSSLYSFLPKYALAYNISVPSIMTTLICGGFLLQMPLGKLSDLFNRERVLVIMSLSCIFPATILLFPIVGNTIIYILSFIVGGITFAIYPISISLACDMIKNRCIIQTTGALLFAYGIGSVFGPILVAGIIDITNFVWFLFAFIIIVLGSYAAIGILNWKKTKENIQSQNSKENVDFVPMPRQSPLANQLDPRLKLSGTDNESYTGDLVEAIHEEIEQLAEEPIEKR